VQLTLHDRIRGGGRRDDHFGGCADIYFRYTVRWLPADRESAELAEQLLADTIAKRGVDRDDSLSESSRKWWAKQADAKT
jgi:hypothetical protein